MGAVGRAFPPRRKTQDLDITVLTTIDYDLLRECRAGIASYHSFVNS